MKHCKIISCATMLVAAGLASADISVSGYFNGVVTKGNDNKQDATFYTVVDPSVAGLVNGTTAFYSLALPGIPTAPSHAGGIATDRLEYLHETNLGMQLYADVTDNFELVAQWVAAAGATGEFSAKTEWAFAKYNWNNFSIRAGRLRTPFYMYSEVLRVGYAYQWVRPPEEIYSLLAEQLNNHNGLELSYMDSFGDLGYSVKIYAGQQGFSASTAAGLFTGKVRNLYGFEGILEVSDYLKLRYCNTRGISEFASPVTTAMQTVMGYLNTAGLSQAGEDSNIIGGDSYHQASFSNVGLEFRYNKFFASAEVARIISQNTGANKSYYVSGGLDLTDRMSISATYGRRDSKSDELSESIAQRFRSTYGSAALAPRNAGGDALADLFEVENIRHNRRVGIDFRYFAYDSVAIKAAWSRSTPLRGTNGLSLLTPIGNHVNYYSLALNLIF